jgi:hypothetical protein
MDVGSIPRATHPTLDPAGPRAIAPAEPEDPKNANGSRPRSLSRVSVTSGRLADLRQPAEGPEPIRLSIRGIGVDARVRAVGVDPRTGTVEIPRDVADVGWYRYGPVPGGMGSAVIVGHVDAHSQGPGALFHLSEVVPGDRVVVRMSDGAARTFVVVARREYPKASLPHALFRRTGGPQLVVVTCGGPFDSRTRHYRDNVVVYAVPSATPRR